MNDTKRDLEQMLNMCNCEQEDAEQEDQNGC